MVKTDVPQKRSDVLDRARHRKVRNQINLSSIHLDASLRNYVSQDDLLRHHKVALFPGKNYIYVNAMPEYVNQVLEAIVK